MRRATWAAAAILVAFMAGSAFAEAKKEGEGNKPVPKNVTLTGVVSVTLNDQKAVTGIKLTVKNEGGGADMVFDVFLDENGKQLAAADGKTITVTGSYVRKDANTRILLVLTAKLDEEKKK